MTFSLPKKKTVLIFIGLGVFIAMWLPRSAVHAQTWQKVGNYPDGDPGFEFNISDAALYSLNGSLYAILDDRYTQVEVYRLDGSDWNKIGGFGDAYTAAYSTGRAMTYYQNNLYAAVRHVEREIIRPDGDVTSQWNVTPNPPHYSAIDDPVLPPASGNVSDYIDGVQWQEDRFTFGNVSNSDNSTGLIVYLYAQGSGNFNQADLDIYYDGSLQSTREIDMPEDTYEWMAIPWANLSLTQAQLNSLEMRLTPKNAQRTYYVAAMYADVVYGSSLKTYKYVSDNNWDILGDTNKACDDSTSAYFNCGGMAITGFAGSGGNLFVGTGKASPSKAQVYRWNGTRWEKYGDGGWPNPAGGLYIPPGGTPKGNLDLIEYNGKLYAGGREDRYIPPWTVIGNISLFEYVSQNNWNRVARENVSGPWFFPNARTLVPINGKLAVMGTVGVFSFDGNQTNSMPLIGQYQFGAANRGMTACGNYLYAAQQGSNGFWGRHIEVWRIDTTDPTGVWAQVGGDFGNEEPIFHGVHMIASLNEKIYVLAPNEEGSPLNSWAYVWEYTGSEGTCTPSVNWTIEGTVWADNDLDGVIDAGESNRGGGEQVTVTPGPLSAFTTNQGTSPPVVNYSISGTGAGTYTVDVSPLLGWVATTTDPETVIVNSSGTYTADFGLVQTGTIQGYIWEDDNDCVRNVGETNYTAASQSVTMTRTTAPVYVYNTCSTASGNGNNFSWSNIMPGDYQVVVGAGCVSGSWPPSGFRETTESSVTVTLAPGGIVDTPTVCKNLVP